MAAMTFKVQIFTAYTFHINPLSGVLPLHSFAILQIILRHSPSSLPSSPTPPSDRFLIKASLFASFDDSNATHTTHLKVAYVGSFLLHYATIQLAMLPSSATSSDTSPPSSLTSPPQRPPPSSSTPSSSAPPTPSSSPSTSPSSKPLKEKPDGEVVAGRSRG